MKRFICELKAAQSAMHLIRKYAVDKEASEMLIEWLKPYESFAYKKIGSLETLKDKRNISKQINVKESSFYSQELFDKMILLIKEELHHFYQVLEIMAASNIAYKNITASDYARGLMKHVRTHEPETLIDKLIIGAYIEARSCERFAKLAPYLTNDLSKFYISLLRSEARHYQDYLHLAELIAQGDISERLDYFGLIESNLIQNTDYKFRLHSGKPV